MLSRSKETMRWAAFACTALTVSAAKAQVCDGWSLLSAVDTGDDQLRGNILSDAFRDAMREAHDINPDQWDEGWGWENPTSVALPYGRVLTALSLLHDAAVPGHDGIASWAGDYVSQVGHELKPTCRAVSGRAVPSVPPFSTNAILIGRNGFNRHVVRRAATLVHETRHHQGIGHNGRGCDTRDHGTAGWGFGDERPDAVCTTLPSGELACEGCCTGTSISCDRSFFEWGANSLHLAWMMDSILNNRHVRGNSSLQQRAITDANDDLRGRFEFDPGFRIESNTASPDFGHLLSDLSEHRATFTEIAGGGGLGIGPPMTLSADTGCFLTHVSGRFQGTGEWFGIRDNGGIWEIAGNSERTEDNERLHVRARCTPVINPVRTYTESLDLQFTLRTLQLEPAGENVCYLTGIRGNLSDSAYGAWLEIRNGVWTLVLNSENNVPSEILSAEVQCMDAHTVLGPLEISESSSAFLFGSGAGPDVMCAIAGMTGQFRGDDEIVEVLPSGDPDYPVLWRLRTNENRAFHTVHGWAVCFDPD